MTARPKLVVGGGFGGLETAFYLPPRGARVPLARRLASRGAFAHDWNVVPSGVYETAVHRAHPDTTMVLCGAPEGFAGPTGEVATASRARSAFALVGALLSGRPDVSAPVV